MTRFNIQWTAKTLTNQMNKGKVNFDNAVQRGLVWDNGKKRSEERRVGKECRL